MMSHILRALYRGRQWPGYIFQVVGSTPWLNSFCWKCVFGKKEMQQNMCKNGEITPKNEGTGGFP